jgi:hypothetical protein
MTRARMGRFTQKIDAHPNWLTRRPPTAGPMAAPKVMHAASQP